MAAGMEGPGEQPLVVVPDEWVAGPQDVSRWYASLPNAVGVFTGTFGLTEDEIEALVGPPPLIPVELDTHDQPNPIAGVPRGTLLSFTIAKRRWQFQVDHVIQESGNRWTAWCYRDSIREVTDEPGT